MVIYQPDKPELLINTAWGIPYKDLETEAAKARKLFIWNDRWVSQEEWERLKREHRVYIWIHFTVLLTAIGGLISVFSGIGVLAGPGTLEARVEGGITLWLGVLGLVVAQLLRRYNPLGRAGAVGLKVLHLAALLLMFFLGEMSTAPVFAVAWHTVWLLVIVRLFYSPLGDVIFSESSTTPAVAEAVPGQEPT